MRSIGKYNIRLVEKKTLEVANASPTMLDVAQVVREKLPSQLWDTWEGADSEITRIIYDKYYEWQRSQ